MFDSAAPRGDAARQQLIDLGPLCSGWQAKSLHVSGVRPLSTVAVRVRTGDEQKP